MFDKKIFGVFVVSLMLLSLLSFVVTAQTSQPSGESILDKVLSGSSAASSSLGSQIDKINQEGFQRFLLLLIVILVVYSVFGFLPFFSNKKLVTFIASVAVGILSVWYLSPDEITASVFSYGALGITLSVLLPFFALFVISKRSADSGYTFLSRFLWVAFVIVLAMRYLTAENLGTFATILFPLLIIASLLMVVLERYIFRSLAKSSLKDSVASGIIDARSARSATMFRELKEWNDMPDGPSKDSHQAHLLRKWGTPARDYFDAL
ncbi:MAG: hypothetical protein ACP5NS_03875 [Candidatus Pacearchaeota archaeon]